MALKFRRSPAHFLHRRSISFLSSSPPFLKISPEVRDALAIKKPVIALETAIYTHGFPHPENSALALKLESLVRGSGCVPATIGILDGIAHIGFEAEELRNLTASAGTAQTWKISRRDLGCVLGMGIVDRKFHGGTTVSGTMALAALASIRILATGGLGGVHRGGQSSMDISADLTEMSRTNMAVISSGVKSFLDIPRTLEYLETQGVGVGTFADGRDGRVDFPGFWTRDSGVRSPWTIKNEQEAAAAMYAQITLPLASGLLFANPVPAEYSIAKDRMATIMAEAIQDAESAGSAGSDNTPFILRRIRELSHGGSVKANRALIEANVVRGAQVAIHLAQLEAEGQGGAERIGFSGHMPDDSKNRSDYSSNCGSIESSLSSRGTSFSQPGQVDVLVAGSVAIDLSCDLTRDSQSKTIRPQLHTSNPAMIRHTLGGVGTNVAVAVNRVGSSVHLCSVVANDIAGSSALEMVARKGLSTAGIRSSTARHRTAQYVAVNDVDKNLVLAMADMAILEQHDTDFDEAWRPLVEVLKPKWVVVDANWSPSTISKWLETAKSLGAKTAFEPVSVAKAKRLFTCKAGPSPVVDLSTPNATELASMYDSAKESGLFETEEWFRTIDSFCLSSSGSRSKLVQLANTALVDQGVPQRSLQLLPFIPCILTTLGEHGVLITELLRPKDYRLTSPAAAPHILTRATDGSDSVGGVYMRLLPPTEQVPTREILSVNGVGDTFLGTVIAGLATENPKDIAYLVNVGQRASIMTLRSMEAVSGEVSVLRAAL